MPVATGEPDEIALLVVAAAGAVVCRLKQV
jgi:hypothetical protein